MLECLPDLIGLTMCIWLMQLSAIASSEEFLALVESGAKYIQFASGYGSLEEDNISGILLPYAQL